jgi:sugar phosphate isomerase/epimerase
MQRLALDHITAVDAAPAELARIARTSGCDGICLFMEPMEVLPLMPQFDIYGDKAARAEVKAVMDDVGVALDLAYPFTLSGRTEVAAFARAMECAADLDAGLINALLYDRDPARRLDTFGRFCDMAAGFDLSIGVEFYPPSQIPSLQAALDLVTQIERPGVVGVNVDLLHLVRSGGSIEALAAAPDVYILYAQIADGPELAPDNVDLEASSERRLCGEGDFDIAGFVRALPEACPLSIEIPRDHAVGLEPADERARRAVASARAVLG